MCVLKIHFFFVFVTTTGKTTGEKSDDGSVLLTAVLVCVSLVAGLILVVAVLAFCVARQCQRLQLQEVKKKYFVLRCIPKILNIVTTT